MSALHPSSPGRPLRIVQILNSLEIGGAERMALNLAATQMAGGHQPHIFCISTEGPLASEARELGIPVTGFDKGPGIRWRTALSMARALWREHPDVVHTHNPPAHFYGAIAARLARVPVIVNTRHSPVSPRGSEHREKRFETLLSITDNVVFVSAEAQLAVEQQWKRQPRHSVVIPNGIPTCTFRRKPARPGAARPRIRFGTVGRLVPVKAQEIMLQAFQRVVQVVPEAELRIVGSGPLADKLHRDRAALGIERRVRIEAPTNDVAAVLSELDVFVISSLSEGLPLVVLEAMASGLPIIATRVGGISGVAAEGRVAWYCSPGDVSALAECMLAAATSSDLAVRGAMAARVAQQDYDVSRMADAYERLYKSTLAGKRPC